VRVDDSGRDARTVFRRVKVWRDTEPPMALLEAELETGRTHQIRVHLTHLGYPLAGDPRYGDFPWNRQLAKQGLKRMFLHAHRIGFVHPLSGQPMLVESPMPPDLERFITFLDAPVSSSGNV
jgi:23S rRNA pseudouridine955/2504/2580 synthase